jgi:hypothetical protein
MSTRKNTAEKIANVQERKQQLENEIKKLLRQEREEERKARTHRICKRGGLLEKLLPDTAALTDEHFSAFLEKVMLSESTRRTLERYTVQGVTAPVSVPTEKESTPAVNTGAEQTESRGGAF